MLIPILLLLVAASLAPLIDKLLGNKSGMCLALLPAGMFGWFLYYPVGSEESWAWVQSLNITVDFRFDGLGRLFALLVTGVGALVVLYARTYLEEYEWTGRFQLYLFLFMASMLGVVLSDNLILFFLFWELTGISSFLLISFLHEKQESRWYAQQALLVTGLGGMALLAGLVLLGNATGQWNISELLVMGDFVKEHPQYPAILTLVLLGALTKSAQFPFHFWLPNAMAAPTPVSAYLHSATMVKAGVFLLAKFTPILGGTEAWTYTLVTLGGITAALGAGRGLFQTDLKKILAYTTLSALGILVLFIGVGTELSIKSALLFLLGHALYKAALFLVAGNIDHATGTRDVTRLGGLRKLLPLTMVAAMLSAFSQSGFPPFFGFLGKEYAYKTTTLLAELLPFVFAPAFFANMLLLALALKVGWHPFWSKPADATVVEGAHEAKWTMWAGPLLLGSLSLLLGLFPQTLVTPLVKPATDLVMGADVPFKLALWHGFNVPLLMSLLTISGGVTLFAVRKRVWAYASRLHPERWNMDTLYKDTFHGTINLAKLQTKIVQSGSLRIYFLVIILFCALLIAYEFSRLKSPFGVWDWEGIELLPACLTMLTALGAFVAAAATTPIMMLLGLGAVGFTIAVFFQLYAAPDLAITQILVETLTVVLFVLVIRRLPKLHHIGSKRGKVMHGIVAAGVGLVTCLLMLKAQSWLVAPSISHQFGELSYVEGKGRNVVNVILVDFRALDTLGEITVLGIAALGVYTLLKSRPRKEGTEK